MHQSIIELFSDATLLKASKFTLLGFIVGKIGIETVDIYTRVILQGCGIIAFLATLIVSSPKIIEVSKKIAKIFSEAVSKALKAIKETFKNG